MMFDPPDFPYKDFGETIKEHYGPEDVMFNDTEPVLTHNGNCLEESMSLQTNDSENYLNLTASVILDGTIQQNSELFIVQSESLFNYEPVLLDDNTVNQFLLPLQVTSSDANKEASNGPDLLALHSCSICHEIFITENDMLEHTISIHSLGNSTNVDHVDCPASGLTRENYTIIPSAEDTENHLQLGTEWLVCGLCDRVLSTASETIDPIEQLCCKDENGEISMSNRTLLTMYVCEFCNSLFADGDALERHKIVCDNQDKENLTLEQNVSTYENDNGNPILYFSCDVCGIQNTSVEELKVHTLECRPLVKERMPRPNGTTTKMWNCGSCNQLFATARDLYRHKRGEDRPEGAPLTAFVCEECDKVLGSMCALHTHKKMHKVTKPGYPCRVCGRRFNQSGHLAIHMRMHTGERPYPCDLCPKAFKVKVERDDHRRTHTGERPFACTACTKTFTAAARLREHARIHTDQRPYRCDICGAAFRRPYARTVHTLIHTGAKPHECDICGTAFRRSGDMWKHKRTLHSTSERL